MFRRCLVTFTLLAASQTAFAQQTPIGAGGQLQQIPPPPAPDRSSPEISIVPPDAPRRPEIAGPTMRVNKVRVAGNVSFDDATLVRAAGIAPGSDLSLSQLRDAAARIVGFYNAQGYFLAQAYIPAQDIVDGNVTIAVVEGRLGKTELHNKSRLRERVARDALSGFHGGEAVKAKALERRLLLLSDIPGLRVKSTLKPGTAVGTTDLIIDIEPGPRFSGSVEADNGGNRFTGTYRLGGTIYLNNPAGIGDQASLRVLGSSGGLAYGRASYQIPLGHAQFGAAFTHLRYELGREFDELDADGTANIFSLYGSYPLVRSRALNLYGQAAVDYRDLADRVGVIDTRSDKNIHAAILGLSGDTRDSFLGGGSNIFSAGWTVGRLDIDTPLDRAADRLTARSQGAYGKIQLSGSRFQNLGGPWSLYASMRGQLAFDNLDSSEKMQLGGAYGVRAYPEGEAYGDQGYIGTLEARLMLNQWTGKLPGQLQLIGFVDAGQINFAHDPWFGGSNHATRSGAGAGLNWAGPHGVFLKSSYATRLGARPSSTSDKSGRFWFHVSKLF